MQTISISELQRNLGMYLKKVRNGDEIIVEDEKRNYRSNSAFCGNG